jgi:DNA polymerase III delta subunit
MINAIEDGDLPRALRELHLMFEGGGSPYQILGQIGWYVRTKLPNRSERRVPAAIRAVFETDFALKTSGGDPQVLLERLLVELCDGRSGKRAAGGPHAMSWGRGR